MKHSITRRGLTTFVSRFRKTFVTLARLLALVAALSLAAPLTSRGQGTFFGHLVDAP